LIREGDLNTVDHLTQDQVASLAKEQEIIDLMIGIYCRGMKHNRRDDTLCAECRELQEYTVERNRQCPFLLTKTKTFCQFCEAHCYSSKPRQAIIVAMRYAGPRMFFHRPIMAIKHLSAVRRHRS